VFIWQGTSGRWLTRIELDDAMPNRLGFLSLPEAQAWAEQEGALMNSADRRLKEREVGA
jgi:hypothetical protein